jgi:MoaD family protein
MKVRAEFYSRLREIVGASGLEVALEESATVNDLMQELYARYPKLREFKKSTLFGIGLEFVERNYQLREGDVVAIMPPVQGG